jgi:hypothetical protein
MIKNCCSRLFSLVFLQPNCSILATAILLSTILVPLGALRVLVSRSPLAQVIEQLAAFGFVQAGVG